MKRTLLLILGLLLALPASVAADSDAAFREQLRKALKDDPNILLDALEANSQDVFSIVEKAAIARQEAQIRRQQDQELVTPLKPKIDPKRVLMGPVDAPLTIVEYSDFQCPFCSKMAGELKKVMAELGDEARLIFKNYPLRMHKTAPVAAYFFEAVSLQNKKVALKFYELLFENQDKLDELGEAGIRKLAGQAGADLRRLEKDLKNPIIRQRLEEDAKEFRSFDFAGVPVVVINGVSVRSYTTADELLKLVERIKQGPVKAGDVPTGEGDDCLECLDEQ